MLTSLRCLLKSIVYAFLMTISINILTACEMNPAGEDNGTPVLQDCSFVFEQLPNLC